jgi:predicted nicotinamide N-methyase
LNSLDRALQDNTYWDDISVAEKSFSIRRIKNIDKLIDAITDEEFQVDEQLPYWAEIWPSSIALSEYILENRDQFSGKKILELGCGLGLVGIVASSVGGKVTFTDNDAHALRFTEENFRRNFKGNASVQLFDWRVPGNPQSFDIILAADIIYEKRWLEPVLNVLELKLTDVGRAFIANPDRTIGREVYKMIEERKWKRQSLLKRTMVYDKLHKIIINRISKC